jgi:hypothetical protein
VAALPLAQKQSDNLSGGGFEAPGSQSAAVERALADDFPAAGRAQLAAVLVPERGASPEQMRAAIGRVADAAGRTANVDLSATARRQAETQSAARPPAPAVRSCSRSTRASPRTMRSTSRATCATRSTSPTARATAWPRTWSARAPSGPG